MPTASIELVLSGLSLSVTIYFWMVTARRERPQLRIYQVGGFRAYLRRDPTREDTRRLCIQQLDSTGVLIANNSTRQNSIVFFDCWLAHEGRQIRGDWGSVGEDRPPWNIGPESTIALGLACFFDVPPDYQIPDSYDVVIEFITASGRRFRHRFHSQVARGSAASAEGSQRAA